MAKAKTSKPKPGKKVNKSAAIRDYKASHPDAKPKEIAEALTAKHGVTITASAVSTTLYNAVKLKKSPSPKSKASASSGVSIEAAVELVKAAGGLEQAKAMLDKIEEIKNL